MPFNACRQIFMITLAEGKEKVVFHSEQESLLIKNMPRVSSVNL